MIYKNFKGEKLSSLGFGTMRFPTVDGDDARVDIKKTAKLIDRAISGGINYFDTAWGYHGGTSESVMGEILSAYPRKSFNLATKFPGFSEDTFKDKENIFSCQLEKCRVDYFDFYLFHNVWEKNIEWFLNPEFGVVDYIRKQKADGKIRHLGFSTHGSLETVRRFLDALGDDIEFIQVQLNYLDYSLQDAKAKVELARERNIPVWVMEPLRGGKLATLSEENAKLLSALRPDESIPAWGFRWLQTQSEVGVVLSGMSDIAQVEENIRIFSEDKPLNANELAAIDSVIGNMTSSPSFLCTACRYCTSRCPRELDIPRLIKLHNEHSLFGGWMAPSAINAMEENKRPASCIGCRACEAVCPQKIEISEVLSAFAKKLDSKEK